ncbi:MULTISPECIES: winged helix-turn-helix transcriptional regulator [Streptomyces]|uniref:winged helix-turn-helix transcriptional regulator n=1 Tax=Streptomyces TaxID=1883 RepID=UPI003410F21B
MAACGLVSLEVDPDVAAVFEVLSQQWNSIIRHALARWVARHGELNAVIPPISTTMLTDRLSASCSVTSHQRSCGLVRGLLLTSR